MINFQEWKEKLKSKPRRRNTGIPKGGADILKFEPPIKSFFVENEDGDTLNIANIEYMTLNKSTCTIFIWFKNFPEGKNGELLPILYDIALQYQSLEDAMDSFYAIEEAVREYRSR